MLFFCTVIGDVNSNDIFLTFIRDDDNTMVDDVNDHNNISFAPSDDDTDIDSLITDAKKFFLFAKLQILFGTMYKTSALDEGDIDDLITDVK